MVLGLENLRTYRFEDLFLTCSYEIFPSHSTLKENLSIAVSILAKLQTGAPRFDFWKRREIFLFFFQNVQTGSRVHPES
jgi:hypothetical protein